MRILNNNFQLCLSKKSTRWREVPFVINGTVLLTYEIVCI